LGTRLEQAAAPAAPDDSSVTSSPLTVVRRLRGDATDDFPAKPWKSSKNNEETSRKQQTKADNSR